MDVNVAGLAVELLSRGSESHKSQIIEAIRAKTIEAKEATQSKEAKSPGKPQEPPENKKEYSSRSVALLKAAGTHQKNQSAQQSQPPVASFGVQSPTRMHLSQSPILPHIMTTKRTAMGDVLT